MKYPKQFKIFRTFYDSNENGGSSRFLVTPDSVWAFIQGLLDTEKDEAEKAYQAGYDKGYDIAMEYVTLIKKEEKKKRKPKFVDSDTGCTDSTIKPKFI